MLANFDLIPPGATPAADQAALHRRRADPGADALRASATATSSCAASPRRCTTPSSRCPTSPPSTIIGGAAARGPRHARRGAPGRLQPVAAAGVRRARRCPTAACRPGSSRRGNREFLLETGEFLRTAEDVRNVVVGVAERQARLPARRRRGDRRRRGALAVRAATPPARASIPPSRSPSPSARAPTPSTSPTTCCAASSALKGTRDPVRRAADHHAATTARRRPRNPTSCSSTC